MFKTNKLLKKAFLKRNKYMKKKEIKLLKIVKI